METLRFRFAARPLPMLLALVFFGAATGLFVHMFLHSDQPIRVLFFLIGGGAAKVFFAVLGACSATFVLLGAIAWVRDILQPRELVVEEETIRIQLGVFRRTEHAIRLADVRAVGITKVYNNRFLVVQHAGGTLQFPTGHLPDETAVRSVLQRLQAATGSA